MKSLAIAATLLVSLALAVPAAADVLTAVLEPPSVHIPVALNLGGSVTGVSEVSVRIQGYSGAAHYSCLDMGGGWETWQPWLVRVRFDGLSTTETYLPLQQEYDETVLVQLDQDVSDWSHLQDGVVMVEVESRSYWEHPDCTAVDQDWMTMDRLELMIVADGVVPDRSTAWSAIKALYR